MFTRGDIQQIETRGSVFYDVERQMDNFIKGFPYLKLIQAATLGNGLIQLKEEHVDDYIELYHNALGRNIEALKFIPASGAASRMFKDLFSFRQEALDNKTATALIESPAYHKVKQFFERLNDFAFYDELERCAGNMTDEKGVPDYCKILDCLFSEKGLNYDFLPKGLIKFHINNSVACTPVYEHMVEGVKYCSDSSGRVNLHFTVSPEHKNIFIEETEKNSIELEKKYGVKFDIQFSVQKPSTDTIAVDADNKPFRLEDGTLLFRPGGHGALLDNLNDILSEIIFIKNIDNVVPDKLKETTIRYKKALAGVLLSYQDQIFSYLAKLNEPLDSITYELLDEIADFLENSIYVKPAADLKNLKKEEVISYLYTKLNRPVRVCGMVKNEGEPGGGPFIAENADGTLSLQIVEESQIDKSDLSQVEILKNATHFNPVDLVCGVTDYKGEKFDLLKYRDPETGFISEKSKDGRVIKAQELPGLWNGAMSDWNTVFVEVPAITFNPVKTVNDLLRKEHQ